MINMANFKKDVTFIIKSVHRLVANEFLDNPLKKPCVDHINHNRHDNNIVNLRWTPVSENLRKQKKRETDVLEV